MAYWLARSLNPQISVYAYGTQILVIPSPVDVLAPVDAKQSIDRVLTTALDIFGQVSRHHYYLSLSDDIIQLVAKGI